MTMTTTAPTATGADDALDRLTDEVDGLPADEEWPASGPRRGLRVRLPAAVLALVATALLGVAGGARLRGADPATGATGAAGAPGAGGVPTGGPSGGPAGGGQATTGTVQSVDGTTVTLTTASGQTVKVTIGAGTTVSRTGPATASDLAAGQTVVVRGTAGADGTTAAQSVTIGSAGPTTTTAPPAAAG
jgi:hypothetical protein